MATARDIISRALRKIGRLGAGREPRLADQEDALETLRSLLLSWVESGAFGRLSDVVPVGDYTAGENQRIFRNSADTNSITLPELVQAYANPLPYNRERAYPVNYEAAVSNMRPPRDGAVVQIADFENSLVMTHIYDGVARLWREVGGIGLDDTVPRSGDGEGLSACLARDLADTFGTVAGEATRRQARRYEDAMVLRFSTPRETAVGEYF